MRRRLRASRLAAVLPAAALSAAALAAALPAGAEELRIEVFADRPQPAADDFIRLTYKLSGAGLTGDIKPPSPLPLKNLALAGGPQRSDQVSFVNGVFSRSLSLTYFLRPKGPGAAEVGETVWTVGEKSLKAAPFLFDVGPARGRSAPPGPRARPGCRPRAARRKADRRAPRHPGQDDGVRRRGGGAPRGADHVL